MALVRRIPRTHEPLGGRENRPAEPTSARAQVPTCRNPELSARDLTPLVAADVRANGSQSMAVCVVAPLREFCGRSRSQRDLQRLGGRYRRPASASPAFWTAGWSNVATIARRVLLLPCHAAIARGSDAAGVPASGRAAHRRERGRSLRHERLARAAGLPIRRSGSKAWHLMLCLGAELFAYLAAAPERACTRRAPALYSVQTE